jgi:hypothetical protein
VAKLSVSAQRLLESPFASPRAALSPLSPAEVVNDPLPLVAGTGIAFAQHRSNEAEPRRPREMSLRLIAETVFIGAT